MKLEEFRMGKVPSQIARKNSSLLDELAGRLGISRAELPMDSIIPLLLDRMMPRLAVEPDYVSDIRTLLQRIAEHFTPQEIVGTTGIQGDAVGSGNGGHSFHACPTLVGGGLEPFQAIRFG